MQDAQHYAQTPIQPPHRSPNRSTATAHASRTRSTVSGASTSSEDAPVARGGGASSSVTGTRTVVAPFDCIWHVHAGEGRQRSVVAAWRQKYGGGDGKKEDALGARLVERAEDLPPPPPRLKRARAIETRE